MKILVTGAAGFIGFHTCQRLLAEGHKVVGIDTLNDYYSVTLKIGRLDILRKQKGFSFHSINIANRFELNNIFQNESFNVIVNLAAQAGVRHSIDKPYEYLDANLIGFLNILESCRANPVEHLIFASSSSVYGNSNQLPWKEDQPANHPISLYASTKKANEMMAHSYASLYNIPCTGLRFFTVYGPWGRPDMAYYKFTKAILENEPITLFNKGELERDFTYIDDVTYGISQLLNHPPKKVNDPAANNESSSGPFAFYNIGGEHPIKIIDFVRTLEEVIGIKAKLEFLEMQPGDVYHTHASNQALKNLIGFRPTISLKTGLTKFLRWFSETNDL